MSVLSYEETISFNEEINKMDVLYKEKIEKIDAKIAKIQLKRKAIKNRKKEKEKKERARRLFKYGEIVEKYLKGVTVEQLEYYLQGVISEQVIPDELNTGYEDKKEPAEIGKTTAKKKSNGKKLTMGT